VDAHDKAVREQIDRQLDELFGQVTRVPNSQLVFVRAMWNLADESARAEAWRNVNRVVETHHRQELLEETRSKLAMWVNGDTRGWGLHYGNSLMPSYTELVDAVNVRRDALPPLLDAAAAIIAADGLSSEDRETLLAPINALFAQPST
jgi:hypothetical protein